MQLVGIENSRIIYLTQVYRPSGQLYLPDAVARLVERYSFVKPANVDQPPPYVFSIGKFQDAQINELSIYNDGLIVSSCSDTNLLDAFVDDLLSWAAAEFGLVQTATAKQEKFLESSLMVKSTADLTEALRPQNNVTSVLKAAMNSTGIKSDFGLSGFMLDFDPGKFVGMQKPFRFVVDRRVGVAFEENVFYSQAPFRTKDHFSVLELMEQMANELG
jgi:hypothetical protein